jgi:hypothetical protein
MEPRHSDDMAFHEQRLPHDWARLILKLRWIGLEDETKRLESAVATLRPEDKVRNFVGRSALIRATHGNG